jgi:peptidoglycan/LPS O-acetylase OafA/YrhL
MQRGGFRYQPALDGLRAFAVSAVIAYHLGYQWAGGGFLGVDTFFVLSGFLITSLLLRERAGSGRISLSGFWARRARRLLPAVFLLLIVVVVYGSTVLNAFEVDQLRGDAIASLFYVANWHFIATGQNYFNLFLTPSPLQHLWSLAIEEQFYLVWPLVVVGVMAVTKASRKALFVVTIAGIVISTVSMALLYSDANPSRAYYGTEARAHTLLVGCLLALILAKGLEAGPRLKRGLGAAGIVAFGIVLIVFATASASPRLFHGGDLAFSILVAIVIAAAVQPTGALRSFLGLAPLRYIGRISYGLYLWHWPVIVFVTTDETGVAGRKLTVLRLAITFAITLASFYLLERPVLRGVLKPRLALAALPASIAVVLAVILVGTSGGESAAAAVPRINHPAGPCTTATKGERQGASQRLRELGLPAPDTRDADLKLMVVGDSRSCSMLTGLEALGRAEGVPVTNAAVLGCGVVADAVGTSYALVTRAQAHSCHGMVEKSQVAGLAKGDPDVILWYSGWEIASLEVDGEEIPFGTPEHDKLLLGRMESMYQRLHREGAKILIVPPVPALPIDGSIRPSPQQYAAHQHLDALYREFATTHPDDVFVADLTAKLCPEWQCGKKVPKFETQQVDSVHFTPRNAAWTALWLWPHILDTLGPGPAPATTTTTTPSL